MDNRQILNKLKRSASSFEQFNPFIVKGDEITLSKAACTFSIWHQGNGRSALQVDNRHYTMSSISFFSDYGIKEQDVVRAVEDLGVKVLNGEDYNKVFEEFRNKQRAKYRTISYQEACEMRRSHATRIFKGAAPERNIHIQNAMADRYRIDRKKFETALGSLGIPLDTDEQYVFVWDFGSVIGTPGYALCDRTAARPIKPNCPEWVAFCQAYGLKPVTCGYVNATHLMDKDNPFSLFSYSVNGGTVTERFVINLATGHIVPADDQLDITHHKGGWYYAYKYLGTAAFQTHMEIVTMEDEYRFTLGSRYSLQEDTDWTAMALVKIARLLYAFGVPEEAVLDVTVSDGNDSHSVYMSIPLLARTNADFQDVKRLMEKGFCKPDGNCLDDDPMIRDIRSSYKRILQSPLGLQSGAEGTFLRKTKAFADRFNLSSDAITAAFEKALMSLNLADIEIFKELVHSAIRKTDLFPLVYGGSANAEHVFIEEGSALHRNCAIV